MSWAAGKAGELMASWPYCTSQWQRLRLAKLAASPVCIICELRG